MDSRKDERGINRQPNGGSGSSDQILTNIRHTRGRMDHTLDELGQKLQPRHLLDEAIDYFWKQEDQTMGKAKETASRVGHKIADQVREHPLPSFLIGAGILWMLAEQRERRAYYPTGEFTTVGEGAISGGKFDQAKEKASEFKGKAQEKIGSVVEGAKAKTHELQGQIQQQMRKSGEALRETAETHPLAIGLGCLAIGVLAGVMSPRTRVEDETMGAASERIKEKGKQQVEELAQKGEQVAGQAMEAGKQEASKQGLSPEGLKEKGEELTRPGENRPM